MEQLSHFTLIFQQRIRQRYVKCIRSKDSSPSVNTCEINKRNITKLNEMFFKHLLIVFLVYS